MHTRGVKPSGAFRRRPFGRKVKTKYSSRKLGRNQHKH